MRVDYESEKRDGKWSGIMKGTIVVYFRAAVVIIHVWRPSLA
jgi:hypothetical protein